MQNFFAMETGIPRFKLDNRRLDNTDHKSLAGALSRINEWNLSVFDYTQAEPTVGAIWRKIAHRKSQGDVSLVVIDGLWLLDADGYEDVTAYMRNMRDLKRMAVMLDVAIIIVHQYNKSGATLTDNIAPTTDNVDGASRATRDADYVYLLKRQKEPSAPTLLYRAKSRGRDMRSDPYELYYDAHYALYKEWSKRDDFSS
jgi:replicative DNA helicase